jgi:hypothetical protein
MRLYSSVCDTEVVVVRATEVEVQLSCCGTCMEEGPRSSSPPPSVEPPEDAVLLGKRYVDESSGIELLCTKAGRGPMACDGRLFEVKAAKALPSSD